MPQNGELFAIGQESGAEFSPCGCYRNKLWRIWDERLPIALLLMLNPSKAGANEGDPTIDRSCVRFKLLGFGGFYVGNLFAFKSTDPRVMLAADDPVGPDNDAAILEMVDLTSKIICAWGKDGAHRGRAAAVMAMLRDHDLYALKVSDVTGQPWHPLYLPYDLQPALFRGKAG